MVQHVPIVELVRDQQLVHHRVVIVRRDGIQILPELRVQYALKAMEVILEISNV
jgi:hypothetical protein